MLAGSQHQLKYDAFLVPNLIFIAADDLSHTIEVVAIMESLKAGGVQVIGLTSDQLLQRGQFYLGGVLESEGRLRFPQKLEGLDVVLWVVVVP